MSADLEDLDAPDYTDDSTGTEDPDGAQNTEGGRWTRPTFTAIHLAAAAAAGLAVGFLAGGATTGAPTPATAALVASTPTAPVQPSTPATPTLPPYNAGTAYPGAPPTTAATAPTHDPGWLATGDPYKATTPAADPLLAGYSTRIAPWYVKTVCYPYVRPDACLVQWEKSQGLFYPDGYKP